MYAMLKKVERCIAERGMLPEASELAIAVSGGADSMCLLDVMRKLKYPVIALHFNHKLRSADSDSDERFVRDYCESHVIPLIVGYPDAPLERGENAAREARYAFFARHASTVATAHTADDNAETIIMRLARGSGISGISGISPFIQRGTLRVIRPIICLTRREVLQYLEYNSIPHIEDASNADIRFTRNRVRAEIIPVLREINPKLAEHALSLSDDLRRDDDYLTQAAQSFLTAAGFSAQSPLIDRAAFRALHPAIASRALLIAAAAFGVNLYREQVDAALKLVNSGKGSWILNLPSNLWLKCNRNNLEFILN